MAAYTYTDDGNNYLSALDYGNGDRVEYNYDDKGRLTLETFEDEETVSYTYNSYGNLATVTDSETGITTTYYYDLLDRMVKYRETSGDWSHTVTYEYDMHNNLSALTEDINGVSHTTMYGYDPYYRPFSVDDGPANETYIYDDLGRIDEIVTTHDGQDILTKSYTYKNPSSSTTSTQVATNRIQATVSEDADDPDPYVYDVTYSYTYDDNGNILSISDGTYTTSYVYDSANQLIRENNQELGMTYAWEYDDAGNIKSHRKYIYTTGSVSDYDLVGLLQLSGYESRSIGDLFTQYDGIDIFYDEIGNPLYDSQRTYTWEHGRELTAISEVDYYTWEYTYDANGMRTSRTCEDTEYRYVYNGNQLVQLTVIESWNTSHPVHTLYFTYSADGTPLTMTYEGDTYYYVTNIQGDVIAILDNLGRLVCRYAYDAWGNVTYTEVDESISFHNPLRYRGYVYDEETRLYYLQSRYYNPEWGRFINADSVMSGVGGDALGYNMFAYCMNNPVNMSDSSGNWPKLIETVANWVKEKIVEPIKAVISTIAQKIKSNIIKYDVPLYNQGDRPLCWAYSQAMIEDSKNGVARTQQEADERAKEIAIDLHGENDWNAAGSPRNIERVTFDSITDLHSLLSQHGPLYATYGFYENGQRTSGHAIVVTGVNVYTNRVYTNNPWGIRGRQKYNNFLQIFAGGTGDGWRFENCYYLY